MLEPEYEPVQLKIKELDYEAQINKAFHNSDFENMTTHLHQKRLREAKKENSKKTKQDSFNFSSHQTKTNVNFNRNVLCDKDFNFDLDQEFLASRALAYQSKDLMYSLKNAKSIEKSLMKIKTDSDKKYPVGSKSSRTYHPSHEQSEFRRNYNPNHNSMNSPSNNFNMGTNYYNQPLPEYYTRNRAGHIYETEMETRSYYNKGPSENLHRYGNGDYIIDQYQETNEEELQRRSKLNEISKMKNEDNMSLPKTKNPFLNFFRSILEQFGCSGN